jgi:hypothetical protein
MTGSPAGTLQLSCSIASAHLSATRTLNCYNEIHAVAQQQLRHVGRDLQSLLSQHWPEIRLRILSSHHCPPIQTSAPREQPGERYIPPATPPSNTLKRNNIRPFLPIDSNLRLHSSTIREPNSLQRRKLTNVLSGSNMLTCCGKIKKHDRERSSQVVSISDTSC